MFIEQTIILKNDIHGPKNLLTKWLDCFFIVLFCLFIFLPILMIISKGLENIAIPTDNLVFSAMNSILVALLATFINLTFSLALCLLIVDEKQKSLKTLIEVGSFSIICISPLVFGTALFLLLFEHIDLSSNALLLTGFTNGILTIPISLAILLPGFKKIKARYGKLMNIIGVSRTSELAKFYVPLLKKNIKFSCALVFSLSIGDLGIIVLFSGNDIGTLPMYLYRLIGSYRMDEAYFVSMILLLLAFISFWLIENGNLNVFKRKQMSD
jgi:thiamine transport system permease protein